LDVARILFVGATGTPNAKHRDWEPDPVVARITGQAQGPAPTAVRRPRKRGTLNRPTPNPISITHERLSGEPRGRFHGSDAPRADTRKRDFG
jgi:hypothetical protein